MGKKPKPYFPARGRKRTLENPGGEPAPRQKLGKRPGDKPSLRDTEVGRRHLGEAGRRPQPPAPGRGPRR